MSFTHLWEYLAEFFLEWEMVQVKVVQKVKTHILCSVTFSENRAVCEIMSKNMAKPQRPQKLRLLARKHTPEPMHPHPLTRTHARTHTHTHTHAYKHVILIAFSRQQRFLEYTSILPLLCLFPNNCTWYSRHTFISLQNTVYYMLRLSSG